MSLLLMFQSGWDNFVATVSVPPGSLWFILLVSFLVSIISNLVNRFAIDAKQMERKQELINDHNKWKKELSKMAEENPKKYAKEYAKFQRRDAAVQKVQQKMGLARMKPTCITMVPMIIMFAVLRNLYSVNGVPSPVAVPPMNPWDVYYFGKMMHASFASTVRNLDISEGWMNFTSYYFLCSMTLSTLIQKIFGLQKATGGFGGSGSGGFGQMFESQQPLPKPTGL
jgi:uncharacterized membrane protein (DUF106 family)